MFKTKIQLVGFSDVNRFVQIVSKLDGSIKLTDGHDYCVNARSLLGCLATVEWDELYCESEKDIYTQIRDFAE